MLPSPVVSSPRTHTLASPIPADSPTTATSPGYTPPPALRQDIQKLALTLGCQLPADGDNKVIAAAFISLLLKLSAFDPRPGTQSAALAGLSAEANPLQKLTQRILNALEDTDQECLSRTSVLVDTRYKPGLEALYRERGIQQEVLSLIPANVREENKQIEKVTQGLLKGTLELHPQLVLMLVHSLYLKTLWRYPFLERNTEPRKFTTDKGETKKIPTMRLEIDCADMSDPRGIQYASSPSLQAIKLPYKAKDDAKERLSMLVVMKTDKSGQQPTQQDVEEAMKLLKVPEQLGEDSKLDICLPKFSIQSKTDLHAAFREAGIEEALDQDPSLFPSSSMMSPVFSRMIAATELHEFSQNCVIKVDELGTEAAASINAGFSIGIDESREFPIHFDGPFSAFICLQGNTSDNKADVEFLFAAQVNDPSIGLPTDAPDDASRDTSSDTGEDDRVQEAQSWSQMASSLLNRFSPF